MAKATLFLLLLAIFHSCATSTAASRRPGAKSANFVRASCSATTYPALCFRSLSPFAASIQGSPMHLAQTALSVSLDRAQSTRAFVYRLSKFKGLKAGEMAAIKDCLQEVGDTVDRLGKSLEELNIMGQAKGQDFQWHASNVETWASAALTDENTCVDGFAGKALNGKVKISIKSRIVNVAHVTSNALALIDKYASRH